MSIDPRVSLFAPVACVHPLSQTGNITSAGDWRIKNFTIIHASPYVIFVPILITTENELDKTVAFFHSVSRYLMVETDKIYFEHMTCSHLMSGSNRESCWHDGNDLNSSKKWWTFVPARIHTKVNIEGYKYLKEISIYCCMLSVFIYIHH